MKMNKFYQSLNKNKYFCKLRRMLIEYIFYYLLQIIFGYLLGDFIMGVYHWVKDTYFNPYTSIIGKTFIWGSRLHHIKPRYVLEFTDKELFIESAKWTLLWMGPLFYLVGPSLLIISIFLTISFNDVVHKYAHMVDIERPKWPTFLQNIHLMQSHNEHHLHHVEPHTINYCPISSFVNIILEPLNFWRTLEKYIDYYFNIKPRISVDDFIEDETFPAGIKFIEK
jgi:hypothetical protein